MLRYCFTRATPLITVAAAGRCCSTNAINNNNSNNNNMNRSSAPFRRPVQQNTRRARLPPAFDVVHWNDADISQGHLLRILHRDSFIVLEYHRQARTTMEAESGETGTNANRAERLVSVSLPPVYIARFLSVLNGRTDRVEIQSRLTNATFSRDPSTPHVYVLQCTSQRPTTGQRQTVDGEDVQEGAIEWSVKLDAAESLMLERFLEQALHHNSGFARHIR